jgi:hypothetical protein
MEIKDIEIYRSDVFINDKCQGMVIQWSANIGFGELTLYVDKDNGKVCVDSECMSKDFVKKVLCELIDEAEIIG